MLSLLALKAGLATRKLWGPAILGFIILAVVAGGYFYISHLNSKVTRLTGERNTAIEGMQRAKLETTELRKGIENAKQNITTINRDLAAAREEAQQYRKKFDDHDLRKLAAAKPGLITRFARRATERVLSDIESAINRKGDGLSGSADSRPGTAKAAPADSN
ncbi:hypothetical protein [Geopsychrobacter electrodiphilus]|uniref:hypothetical protein n=1 Tax=Geopsychrobacter electrodiphilus TaxID=225196 RepID=UPI000375E73A|nr:hypothetical protein [Geopsychrobacter electrodiphilus]